MAEEESPFQVEALAKAQAWIHERTKHLTAEMGGKKVKLKEYAGVE